MPYADTIATVHAIYQQMTGETPIVRGR